MPRSRSAGGRAAPRAAAPKRPTVPPTREPGSLQRSSSSLAASPSAPGSPAMPQQGQGQGGGVGGLVANVASTAAGVAIGHSIGNAFTSMFGGGSSDETPASANPAVPSTAQQAENAGPCNPLMKELTQCMTQNGAASPCQWIFDQLKLCQEADSANKQW